MAIDKKISIYVVEDYLLIRKSLIHILTKEPNFEVLGDFENAETFLEVFSKHPSDVVLMDLGLTGMNGVAATKIIKEQHPETKVVILTSHDESEEVMAALFYGASAYCLKDIDSLKLNSVIMDVANGDLWLDSKIAYVAKDFAPKPCSTDLKNLYKDKKVINSLTEREREVLKYIVDGKSNTEIAEEMFISMHTAKAHVGNILNKLSVSDRVQAAVKAIRTRIVD